MKRYLIAALAVLVIAGGVVAALFLTDKNGSSGVTPTDPAGVTESASATEATLPAPTDPPPCHRRA